MRMGGRAVEGARLESVCTPKGYRGFESHPIRQYSSSTVSLAKSQELRGIAAIAVDRGRAGNHRNLPFFFSLTPFSLKVVDRAKTVRSFCCLENQVLGEGRAIDRFATSVDRAEEPGIESTVKG